MYFTECQELKPVEYQSSSSCKFCPDLNSGTHFLGFARKDKLLHVSVGSMEVVSVKGLTISFPFQLITIHFKQNFEGNIILNVNII